MRKRVTLYLKDEILARALEIANRSDRDMEDVLAEWIVRYADDLPVETLSDEEVLALCDFEMNSAQQDELRKLLYNHRERNLDRDENARLEALLKVYRKGIIRKARALEVAEARGLFGHEDGKL